MCRDSLTELGHTYEERSSNAKHPPPKKKKNTRKPATVGESGYMSGTMEVEGGKTTGEE